MLEIPFSLSAVFHSHRTHLDFLAFADQKRRKRSLFLISCSILGLNFSPGRRSKQSSHKSNPLRRISAVLSRTRCLSLEEYDAKPVLAGAVIIGFGSPCATSELISRSRRNFATEMPPIETLKLRYVLIGEGAAGACTAKSLISLLPRQTNSASGDKTIRSGDER